MEKVEQTYKLTEGWENARIQDISVPSTKTNKSKTDITGDFYYIDVNSIDNNSFSIVNPQKYNWNTAPSRAQQIIKTNNILIATVRPYLRNIAIVNEKYNKQVCSSAFCVIHPIIVNAKYVYYYVLSNQFILSINKLAKGTSYPAVTNQIVLNQTIPLAPLLEQHRIVSKIETLFSELEHAEKNLHETKKLLETYRQSLLKNVFNNSQGKASKLGDNISKISRTIKPNNKTEYKFIGLDSINPGSTKLHLIYDFINFSSSGSYFSKGNLLYSRMRPNLNKVYKAEFEGVCSGEFFVIKCDDNLNADYLKYLLHSIEFVSYATNKAKGDRPRLSYGDFASYEIKMVPITEQIQIVEELDNKFTLIDNVADTIDKCFKEIEFLRYSVLRKAFDGKLVNQEPTDEPVRKLLELIKKEKIEYLKNQKETLLQKPKRILQMDSNKTVWQILSSSKIAMRTEKLWSESKHKDDIDAFYAEVKELIDSGKIVEDKRQGKVSYLKVK